MSCIDSFLKYLEYEKKYSQHTVASYRRDLKQYSLYVSARLGLESVMQCEHMHVRSWVVHLMSHDYQPRSVNRKISVLRSFYKYLLRQGHIDADPTQRITALKLPKRLPKALPKEVILKALENEDTSDFVESRDSLIIDMLYSMGLRRAELLGLSTSDIDTDVLQIKVLGKGNKERLVPITTSLMERLALYLELRSEVDADRQDLFLTSRGAPLSPRSLYSIVVDRLGRYTSADARNPHVLRHSFATHMADEGADLTSVKDIMGHASLASTEIYLHSTVERLLKAYEGSHPRA